MAKKRTMNEYRQSKEYVRNAWELYNGPKIGSEGEVELEEADDAEVDDESILYMKKLKALRKKYPNDQQFGYHVAKELL